MEAKQQRMFAIPNFIYESLEAALKAESRRLVRDIATTLKTNEMDLWREVSKATTNIYLVSINEPTNEQFECCSYEHVGKLYKPCRKPVVYGEKVCPNHRGACLTKPPSHLPRYRILKYFDDDTGEVNRVYLNPATNEVFCMDTLEVVGTWGTEEKCLTLFEKEE